MRSCSVLRGHIDLGVVSAALRRCGTLQPNRDPEGRCLYRHWFKDEEPRPPVPVAVATVEVGGVAVALVFVREFRPNRNRSGDNRPYNVKQPTRPQGCCVHQRAPKPRQARPAGAFLRTASTHRVKRRTQRDIKATTGPPAGNPRINTSTFGPARELRRQN